MHEKLHAVSFSSLNKLLKKVKPTYVIISSRRDESFLADMVALGKGPKNLSLISSSRRNIELVHKILSKEEKLKCFYKELKLVSMEEIEHEIDSAYKSFVKTHSNGYHTARIVLTKRS
ncbi:unnamed protein product [Cuscuta campestris]|uniref:Uncharacterized protein n=1 Tax=Cuscuta campestris TaxID=132261 RepID=A0A484NMX4_9ASTE|nr:unnamed protein product [Cuscuta campestris]